MVDQATTAPTQTIPPDLERKARNKDWSLDAVEKMLQRFSPFQVQIAMDRMTQEQAEKIMSGERPSEDTPLFTPGQE